MDGAEQNSIVKDFYIGNTHVKISGLYCREQTAEEVEATLKHISRRAQEALSAKEAPEHPRKAENTAPLP